MKNTVQLLALLLIVVVCEIAAKPPAAQDAASQIKGKIESLQRSLKDKSISDPNFAPVNSMAGDSLKAASEALNAGRLYLSLETLAEASNLLQGARVAEDSATVVKGGLPAFESQWGEASLKLTALDQQAQTRGWDHSSAAIRSLSEAAQGRSLPLLEGGRGFATATEPKDGLFYLGEAQGEAEFAQFCATLHLPAKATPFPLRSLLPELVRRQEKTNAAFQPPRSIELHPRFIALNSTLKLAQELDARKFYAGALYQYLEAVRHYGMLDAAPLDAARQVAVKEAVAAAQTKLAASTRDDSIAQLFVERAASQVAHADGSAPSADEWRSAQVIVEQVAASRCRRVVTRVHTTRPSRAR